MNTERIRQLCKEKNVSLRSLAFNIGVTEATIHRYMRKNWIPADKLELVSNFLNVPINSFLDEDPGETNSYNISADNGSQVNVNGGSNRYASPQAETKTKKMYDKLKEEFDSLQDKYNVQSALIQEQKTRLKEKDQYITELRGRISDKERLITFLTQSQQ